MVFFVDEYGDPWTKDAEVYVPVQNDHNLNNDRPIKNWNEKIFPSSILNFPAAKSMAAVSGDLF